jgi:hypothetical protein
MMKKRPSMRRTRSRRRGGTAIVEFTMAIPLLAMVLLLTFSFGWAMTNQQHVWVSDRYACWRQVRTGVQATNQEINQSFFGGRASSVSATYEPGHFSQDAQDYASYVASGDAAAGDLARGLVMDHFPRDMRVRVQAEFPTGSQLWRRFTGAIRTRDAREGVEWRWRQARCETEVADQLISSMDGTLATTPAPADVLCRFLRSLYRQGWSYHDWPYGTDGNAN